MRQQAGDDLVSIFVLPPSHDELERRLRARAQDAEDVVQARMAKANNEISHWAEYDYVVINDDLGIDLAENAHHSGRRAHEARAADRDCGICRES